MRHVDDAHHAKGDRETDGRKKENRGQGKRVERQVNYLPRRDTSVDQSLRSFGRFRNILVWFVVYLKKYVIP